MKMSLGSPYQQFHGAHKTFKKLYGYGFEIGPGLNQRRASLDPLGNPVHPNSPEAHWPVKR
jgi:hypothetical protein